MTDDTNGLVIAVLYFLGAYSYYSLLRAKELVLSLAMEANIHMIAWQKTLACVLWPGTAVLHLALDVKEMLMGPNNTNKDDNDSAD